MDYGKPICKKWMSLSLACGSSTSRQAPVWEEHVQHVAYVTHADLKVDAGSISLCHISFTEASQSLMACDK